MNYDMRHLITLLEAIDDDKPRTVIKLSGWGKRPVTPDSPSTKFIDAFRDATTDHPLNPKLRVAGMAAVHVTAMSDNKVHITDIQSHQKGDGTKAMEMICKLADQFNVTLDLTAMGYDDTPTPKLIDWYRRFGFFALEEDEGEGVDMVRYAN